MRIIFGAGYTGSRVALRATRRGERVIAVVRSPERAAALENRGFEVTREEATAVARRAIGPDTHAIICFPPDGATDAALAPLLANAGAITYLSTTGVYGDFEGVVDDRTPVATAPSTRMEAENAYRHFGATILRAPGIYGSDRGLHVRVMRGDHAMPGTGERALSRIHVEDLAELLLASRRVRGETYVVGDLEPAPQRDVVRWICETYGCAYPRSVPPEQVHESLRRNRRIEASRVLSALSVQLRFPTYREGMLPRAVPDIAGSRSLTLVDGYLEADDGPPLELRRGSVEGLSRVGLAMNRHYAEFEGGQFFDHELAVAISDVVASLGDRCSIRFDGQAMKENSRAIAAAMRPSPSHGDDFVFDDVRALERLYERAFALDDPRDPSENEAYEAMKVTAGERTVAEVRTIDFHAVGGPDPYHDTLLWNVYVTADARPRLLEGLGRAFQALGVTVTKLEGASKHSRHNDRFWALAAGHFRRFVGV